MVSFTGLYPLGMPPVRDMIANSMHMPAVVGTGKYIMPHNATSLHSCHISCHVSSHVIIFHLVAAAAEK